jgi:hypothetical protein
VIVDQQPQFAGKQLNLIIRSSHTHASHQPDTTIIDK